MLVKCERLDDFGRGVGRVDGKVVFIDSLIPEEEALIEITSNKKKYMIGKVIKIIKKSPKRMCSKCPYELCGCALKSLKYEDTLEYKKNKVKNMLKKFSDLEIDNIKITPSDSIYKYRNKITLKVKNGEIGYYKNGTNEIIEIDKCLIATDKINKIIDILRKENLSKVNEIIIKDMDETMVIIKGDMNILNLINYSDSIYINNKLVYGKDKILSSLGKFKFLVSKDSFFQINKNVTLKLYNEVLKYAGDGETLIDLYCGAGTISTFLSQNYKNVIGIEINKEAVECARDNIKINNISNIKFKCGDAGKLVKGLKCDTLVVDPARSGLSKEGISNILEINPKKIVYVSCNPVTLARDLKLLDEKYILKDISLFDMFPWTYHVECVCLLERY